MFRRVVGCGVYPTFVDWIVPVTKQGQLRLPACHTALYRLALFTDLPYRRIRSVLARHTSMRLFDALVPNFDHFRPPI